MAVGNSMCYIPPSHFGQGKIIYANHLPWYIAWLSDFIFYPKPLYKSLHQSFFYSFITILPSESGVYTRAQYDFHIDPIILPCQFIFQPFVTMSVYFSAIKRDLAILTEWWELLNAARQIICIRKQQHTWYKTAEGSWTTFLVVKDPWQY
jgi:hypothetical protein